MPHPPTWFDWLTVTALFFGPVFALLAQRSLDHIREKRNRRYKLYATLMSLRNDPLNPDHVRALNSLDAVFDGRGKDSKLRDAWSLLLAHVNSERTDENSTNWDNTLIDRRVDVYQAVGRAVGYDHTIEYIRTRLYAPKFFEEVWLEQTHIRKALVNSLTTEGIKVILSAPPQAQESSESRKR